MGQHVVDHHARGIIIGVRQTHFALRVVGPFACGQRHAGFGCDLAGHFQCRLLQIYGGNRAVDQANFSSACGGGHVTGQQHFHCVFVAHVARQGDHRGRAEQANMYARCAELRRVGGNGQIATCHELTARCRCHASDLGDHRFGAVHNSLHDAGTHRHDLGKIRLASVSA